jgi:hypothetical protein
MHWQQTGSATDCTDTRKLQMAAKTVRTSVYVTVLSWVDMSCC